MKKEIAEIIKKKFDNDMLDIDCKIRSNKREINVIANKQRQLKATKKALYEIIRLIK